MSKEINVKSKNQKNGITAGIVNIHKGSGLEENKGVWANPYFKFVVIPLLVGLIIWGITKMFNNEPNKDKKVYNVTSHNQQGGITAGEVNFRKEELQPRIFHLEQNDKEWKEGSLFHKQYFFGSKQGILLSNITIRMRFDRQFKDVKRGIVGNGFTIAANLDLNKDDDSKGLTFSTQQLLAGNYIRLEIIGNEPISDVLIETSP